MNKNIITVLFVLISILVSAPKANAETCKILSINSDTLYTNDLFNIFRSVDDKRTKWQNSYASNETMLLQCGDKTYGGVAIGCTISFSTSDATSNTVEMQENKCRDFINMQLKWLFYYMTIGEPVNFVIDVKDNGGTNMCIGQYGCPTSITRSIQFAPPVAK